MSVEWQRATPDQLLAGLRQLDRESLELALENESFNEDHVRLLLKDPGLDAEMVERLSRVPRFFRRGDLRLQLVLHPRISRVRALELVRYLYWRDALRVATALRVHPQVRVVAEQQVAERSEELTLGERMTIARTASRAILQALRVDGDPRVVQGLLQNYRCTEEDVIFMAIRAKTTAQVLGVIARHPKWRVRPAVRSALVRNRRLPLPMALGLLEQLSAGELLTLTRQRGLPRLLRESARRLAEERRRERGAGRTGGT